MTVKQLIAALKMADPNLEVSSHANNHTYHSERDRKTHGEMKVLLRKHNNDDEYVVIGNVR
ncbi:hypothetical protein LCGC14_0610360 [marine sediment metagenome]|uniref:Uncharacterized protein n=1 Tax=marine sediment metagenome TaxID=412755 RepID=A0A0F9RS17_9ZZZZ